MSVTRAVAYNTASQIFGKVTTAAISLVVISYLTRYLGVEGFGHYTIAFTYASFFAVLADLGFFWILMRELTLGKADKNYLVSNIFTMRFLAGVMVYGLAALVGFLMPYPFLVKLAIAVAVTNMFWLTINHTLVGVFQANMRIDKAVFSEVVGRIVIASGVLYLIKIQAGLLPILGAYSAGSFINLFLSLVLVRKYIKIHPAFDFALWRKIFWQALPMGIIIILGLIYFKVDILILSLMKGGVDVGIYGAPYKVIEIILALPPMFMGAVFPVLSTYIAHGDKRLSSAAQKSFDFLSILAAPIVGGTLILAYPIMRLVSGESFAAASTIQFVGYSVTTSNALQILIFAVGLSYLTQFFSYLVIASGLQKSLLRPMIYATVFNVVLNIIFIPKFSYAGAAVVTVCSEVLLLILELKVAYQLLRILPKVQTLLKSILASAVMIAILLLISPWPLALKIITAIVTYFVVLYLVKGVNKGLILSIVRAK